MHRYYDSKDVRTRLVEYAGRNDGPEGGCMFYTQCDGGPHSADAFEHASDLEWFLEEETEIARSFCDSRRLLVHLDMEYVNFDSPIEAFVNPYRAFAMQQPVVEVIEERLLQWGIVPLHLITGQGHHFVWSIDLGSRTERALADLAPVESWMWQAYDRTRPYIPVGASRDVIESFNGLGLVMEFLANEVRKCAASRASIPVDTTAVTAGPCEAGRPREIVSLDISEYGDPIHTRAIRMPFSRYLKPRRSWISGYFQAADDIPEMFVLPLHEMDVYQALETRCRPDLVTSLAKRASVRIPDQGPGMDRLIADYLASPLRSFHEQFHRQDYGTGEIWAGGNLSDVEFFPPCVRHVVQNPNDWLLKPAGIQMVVRTLLAIGWQPRSIAEYIRSRLCEPGFGWGDMWRQYDPGLRSYFYTRLFAGQVATGVDSLVDFNCKSTQEKGFCYDGREGCSLSPSLQKLKTKFHHHD